MVCLCKLACFAATVVKCDRQHADNGMFISEWNDFHPLCERGGGKNQYPLSVKGGFMFG